MITGTVTYCGRESEIGTRIRLAIEFVEIHPSAYPYDHALLNREHKHQLMSDYRLVVGGGMFELFGYQLDWSLDVPMNQIVFHSPHYPRNRRIPLGG